MLLSIKIWFKTILLLQDDKSLNLIKVDPLAVNKISINQGGDSPVTIDLEFTNTLIHGISSAKITSVK